MINNGDFELGSVGFTSDYTDVTGQITFPNSMAFGDFAIDTDADIYNQTYFGSLGDHTTGTGKYFISDAGTNDAEAPWISEKTIIVSSTTATYRFEAYIADVNDDPNANDLPQLSFELGDGTTWVPLGSSVDLSGKNMQWVLTTTDVKFSKTGTYMLRLRNTQTNGIGNDFGLDDLYFGLCSGAPSSTTSSCSATPQTINIGALVDSDPSVGAYTGTVSSPLTSPSASDVSNCNAGEVNTVSFAATTVFDQCTGFSDTGKADVRITYTANSQRYDLTFTHSVAGDSLVDGAGASQSYLGGTAAGSGLTKDLTI
jgi:hypothetical protein